MTISIESLQLSALQGTVLEKTRVESSAFQQVGTNIGTLPLQGTSIEGIANIQSKGVKEGGEKTASGIAKSVKMGAEKFVSTAVMTQEAFLTQERVVKAVWEKQPQAHGVAYDLYIAGIEELPEHFANFVTLGDAQVQEISTGVEGLTDMDDARAKVLNGKADKHVYSTAFLAYLKRQRNANTGVPIHNIEGDTRSGTIDGETYRTFVSTVPVGFVGDFDNFYWGVNGVADEFMYQLKDAGTIKDSGTGVEHNLTSQNKVALMNELFQGAQVVDKTNFVKLVPAATV
jgi:hypothetical protein